MYRTEQPRYVLITTTNDISPTISVVGGPRSRPGQEHELLVQTQASWRNAADPTIESPLRARDIDRHHRPGRHSHEHSGDERGTHPLATPQDTSRLADVNRSAYRENRELVFQRRLKPLPRTSFTSDYRALDCTSRRPKRRSSARSESKRQCPNGPRSAESTSTTTGRATASTVRLWTTLNTGPEPKDSRRAGCRRTRTIRTAGNSTTIDATRRPSTVPPRIASTTGTSWRIDSMVADVLENEQRPVDNSYQSSDSNTT